MTGPIKEGNPGGGFQPLQKDTIIPQASPAEVLQGVRERLERITPDDYETVVGKPEEVLKRGIPDFGARVIEGMTEAVRGGLQHAEMVIVSFKDGKPDTAHGFRLTNPDGNDPRTMQVAMAGDWREGEQVPPGRSIEIKGKDEKLTYLRLFRRLNPQAEPLAEVGKWIEPNGAIMVGMKGKKAKIILILPKVEFPKGGTVTAILVPDDPKGHAIKISKYEGFIYIYVEPT